MRPKTTYIASFVSELFQQIYIEGRTTDTSWCTTDTSWCTTDTSWSTTDTF